MNEFKLWGLLLACACGYEAPASDAPPELPAKTVSTAIGTLLVAQQCFTLAGSEHCTLNAAASFFASTPKRSDCSVSTVHGCTITECADYTQISGVTTPQVNAGALTFTGAELGSGISLTFSGQKYDPWQGSFRAWAGGESLSVSSTGGKVPAFAARSVTAPSPVSLVAPACSVFGCPAMSRGDDLPLQWTGNATVRASMQSTRDHALIAVSCDLGPGNTTIPGAALAHVGLDSDGYSNTLVLTPLDTETFTVGDYTVMVLAQSEGSSQFMTFTP